MPIDTFLKVEASSNLGKADMILSVHCSFSFGVNARNATTLSLVAVTPVPMKNGFFSTLVLAVKSMNKTHGLQRNKVR